ncbi:MAG TPA: Hsp20/alpha crystallin family protein [Gallionella sp.]|nr:Hsp20/alpha crystallin family protein [Gallionella sp.]
MANIIRRDPFFSNLTRFDPFRDDWLKGFGMQPFTLNRDMDVAPQIKIDLTESDKDYKVMAEIPGVKKEDINVKVEGNRVSISAEVKQENKETEGEKVICCERYEGSTYRSFTLDNDVDETKAQAKYENGVLQLTLPKKNGSTAKQLQVM